MNVDLRHPELQAVRLVVGMLPGLGFIVGSIALLYVPWDLVMWIAAVGLAIAVGIAIIPFRPMGYVTVGWSGILVVGCAAGLVELAVVDAPVGVLLALLVAAFCLGGGGLLEVGVLRRQRPAKRAVPA